MKRRISKFEGIVFSIATAVTVALGFPTDAFGVVQCYCRGQYKTRPDGTNCRRECVGDERPTFSPAQPSYAPSNNNLQQQQIQQQQIQQQQREEEERIAKAKLEAEHQRRMAEEAQRREEFEKGKQEALSLIQGGNTAEFGFKNFDADRIEDQKRTNSNNDPSVVDLRHLDPNKPITVDPNIAKGKGRKIPIQVLEKTLNNDNYMNGFNAIRAGDHSLAIQYFRKALVEIPNDVLVKNALALAQDLENVHRADASKDVNKKIAMQANIEAGKGFQSMIDRDYDSAINYYKAAASIDPSNKRFRDEMIFLKGVRTGAKLDDQKVLSAERNAQVTTSWRLFDNSFVATTRGDYVTAISLLETALSLNPSSKGIQDTLDFMKRTRGKK